MGPGAGARGAQAMEALQADVAPQLIEAVQQGITAQQLAQMLHIPADQAAALIQTVRQGEDLLTHFSGLFIFLMVFPSSGAAPKAL